MIPDTKDKLEWQKFLNTPAGRNGLSFLQENCLSMPITKTVDPHVTALEAGAFNGYRRALQDLESLTILSEEKPQNLD